MNGRVLACWILLVAFGGVLSAQRGLPPIDIIGVEPMEFGEVVRGAPFSAEATTEMTQELRDGNRIEQRSTVTIARDSMRMPILFLSARRVSHITDVKRGT